MSNISPNAAPPRPEFTPFDGLLLVDKPSGPTSHDIVAAVRRRFRIEKVGHGGTLDPAATGLLILLLGRATRLSDRVMGGDKTYEGTLRLGANTSTQDAQGETLETADASAVTSEALNAAMARFRGDLFQTPPMVSALKRDGVPLYKLARKGETVERAPRLVHVYEFRLVEFGIPDSRILVRCTKGTYVRTLCHDVGEALGCHGHLAALRRTRSGALDVANALPFERVLDLTRDELAPHIIPMLKVV
jgi:tRNA pseudouridine55 synthase